MVAQDQEKRIPYRQLDFRCEQCGNLLARDELEFEEKTFHFYHYEQKFAYKDAVRCGPVIRIVFR